MRNIKQKRISYRILGQYLNMRSRHKPEEIGETWKLRKCGDLDWNLEHKGGINKKTSEVKRSVNNVPCLFLKSDKCTTVM